MRYKNAFPLFELYEKKFIRFLLFSTGCSFYWINTFTTLEPQRTK